MKSTRKADDVMTRSRCILSCQDYVTLVQENGEDIAKALVTDGLVTVEKRKEKRLQKVLEEYNRAQDGARKARVTKQADSLHRPHLFLVPINQPHP